MNSTQVVIQFLTFLATTRAMFRETHLFAERNPNLRTISTIVIPFKGAQSDYAEGGVTLSIALNAEIREVRDTEKQAIGMSLLIRRSAENWIAEAEIGWTGKNVGWDSFDSREARTSSVELLMLETPSLIEWLDARFREEVAEF